MEQQKLSENALYQLDICFLDILKTMILSVENSCEEAAEFILKSSSQFISDRAHTALDDFKGLYFGGESVDEQKEAMNAEVDDLMDSIKAKLDAGEDVDSAGSAVDEDEAQKKSRLGLSGIQKELETIIQLEQGIKEKLVPVLTSMQFEDIIKHRLQTIDFAWEHIIEALKGGQEINKGEISDLINSKVTSNAERKLFYEIILKEEPPKEELVEETVFLDLTGD